MSDCNWVGLSLAEGGDNPYLDEYRKCGIPDWDADTDSQSSQGFFENLVDTRMRRDALTKEFAWAVPNRAAILTVAQHSPLIEIGAGTGYWAMLLRHAGANIRAYDLDPAGQRDQNPWHNSKRLFSQVQIGGPEKISEFPGRTLFLCWPPLGGQMVADCLHRYQGHTLLYVGEVNEATGWDVRLDWGEPEGEWDLQRIVDLPRWYGIRDSLLVFRRKGHAQPAQPEG